MKKKSLLKKSYLLIFVSVIFISCNRHFNEYGIYQGYWHNIQIDSNHTFRSEVGSPYYIENDTCSGTWIKKNGCLVLNSYRQPNNEKDFNINEEFCDSISLKYKVIQVQTGPFFWQESVKDSVMTWFNNKIIINNKIYTIPWNGKLILQIKEVKTIEYSWRFTHYPVYQVKNNKSNYFLINLNVPDGHEDLFPSDSYYYNAKFKIRKSSLIFNNYILKKVSSKPCL
jgi:hypothetical protein